MQLQLNQHWSNQYQWSKWIAAQVCLHIARIAICPCLDRQQEANAIRLSLLCLLSLCAKRHPRGPEKRPIWLCTCHTIVDKHCQWLCCELLTVSFYTRPKSHETLFLSLWLCLFAFVRRCWRAQNSRTKWDPRRTACSQSNDSSVAWQSHLNEQF